MKNSKINGPKFIKKSIILYIAFTQLTTGQFGCLDFVHKDFNASWWLFYAFFSLQMVSFSHHVLQTVRISLIPKLDKSEILKKENCQGKNCVKHLSAARERMYFSFSLSNFIPKLDRIFVLK